MLKDKTELYEIAEQMEEMIGSKELLENLMMAMDSDELQKNLEFIDRMMDMNIF